MATLIPLPAYTSEQLSKLYPQHLQLEQVQIVLRHGERTPVSSRFQNAGLPAYWPYCQHAQRFKDIVQATGKATEWETMTFRRHLETFGNRDMPVAARSKNGELNNICSPGELTSKGRETTLALGERLRHLYVDQLRFLPEVLSDSSTVTLRATPIQRALESVQQTFYGLYPVSARTATCPPPTVIQRAIGDETLFPNTGACKRFGQLFEQFIDRAAKRWNDTEEMEYLNQKIGKWMPESSPRVKVDSKPRLGGIMDTLNATKAHGPETRLPKEFYDERLGQIIDKISCEEWFSGFHENKEYRQLGIGSLVGDITTRMIWHAERASTNTLGPAESDDATRSDPKIWLAGAHDTTLAGMLAAVGAFDGNPWPPFTSHVAVELFKSKEATHPTNIAPGSSSRWWWSSLWPSSQPKDEIKTIARKPTKELTDAERQLLRSHFVRLRYNGVPATVPGCKKPGKHLEGDESFCTLEAFKEIVEEITPRNWKTQCRENLDQTSIDPKIVPAGYAAPDISLDAAT